MVSGERFTEYFTAVHGHRPFPWQERLAGRVIGDGEWPEVISLPTGAGKTAVIDVAIFAQACGARLPRRTVMVVDRRLVVDAAYDRAKRIRDALCSADRSEGGILGDVARGLLELGGEHPLEVALLRGGIPLEASWISDPAQPMLICSTVDQVGSRLLHRGYGVSPSMRPVHAGLLGNDTLIILDEAHISEPFRQTLAWIREYRGCAEHPLGLPFGVVTMSATVRDTNAAPFMLESADMENPVLRRRLEASKPTELRTRPKKAVSKGLADAAVELSDAGRTILVVCNRVARARETAELIHAHYTKAQSPAHVIVLTGRSRPVDRHADLDKWRARLFSGRDRSSVSGDPPLFVVATQTIEVGADIDADALVSEACPIDSLRQRAGRVDRLGERGESRVIVVGDVDLDTKDDEKSWEPVYGTRTATAWKWLRHRGDTVDMGHAAWDRLLRQLDCSQVLEAASEVRNAPVVFPAYCDLWVQTRPEPDASPNPAIFLHGSDSAQPDVSFAWRSDLGEDPDTWIDTVSLFPPSMPELLPVPIWAARVQIQVANPGRDEAPTEASDVESVASPPERRRPAGWWTAAPFLIWRGTDASIVSTDARDIVPGDTIVLPSSRGGCDRWGLIGDRQSVDAEPTSDEAELARRLAGRPPVLRLHPAVASIATLLERIPASDGDGAPEESAIADALDRIAASPTVEPGIKDVAVELRDGGYRTTPHPSGEGWVLVSPRRSTAASDASTEDEVPTGFVRSVHLSAHLSRVAGVARRFASAVGLEPALQEDLEWAAAFHDIGKCDPRFQTLLYQGQAIRPPGTPMLAKSTSPASSRSERERVRVISGYPQGARHELLSLALIQSTPDSAAARYDWDLVQHIIASHHGWCRPLAPVFVDSETQAVAVRIKDVSMRATTDCIVDGTPPWHIASGIAERFHQLNRRYGWWGLSYLEALVRLADHAASRTEAEGDMP